MRLLCLVALCAGCSDGSVRRNEVPEVPEVPDPCIELSPERLAFHDATVPPDEVESLTVTIRNGCDGLLDVVSLMVDDPQAPFDFGRIDSPRLAKNESISFDVEFRPTLVGRFTADLLVDSNDPTDARLTVRLVGTAVE